MSGVNFLMVRHGMCDSVGDVINGRRAAVHLNADGIRQAESVRNRLRNVPLEKIFSSPLERTKETAQPLSSELNLPVEPMVAFHEIDYGVWTGKPLAELNSDSEWQQYNLFRGGRRIPGGEMNLEVQSRAVAAMEHLRSRHPRKNIAIFTHGDVIRAVLLHYLGAPLEFITRIEILPGSISIINLSDWGPKILKINEI